VRESADGARNGRLSAARAPAKPRDQSVGSLMAFTADDIRANREYLANKLRAMSIRS